MPRSFDSIIDRRPLVQILLDRGRRPAALLAALWMLALPWFVSAPAGMGDSAWRVTGVFVACMILWITSALPHAATGLLALATLPLWMGQPAETVFGYFGNRTVFFLISAFLIAAAMRETGLSLRMALWFFSRFGKTARGLAVSVLVFGFVLSWGMPEHAVAAIMFPILLELMDALQSRRHNGSDTIDRFGTRLFLAMVWGVVIGGVITLLGGARNPLALSILEEATGQRIGFAGWLGYSLPLALPVFGVALMLLLFSFRDWPQDISYVQIVLDRKRRSLGRANTREKLTGLVVAGTLAGWLLLGENTDMAVIGLLGTQVLFFLNLVSFAGLQRHVDWGVIFLYGGAIALGKAMLDSGSAHWFASHILSTDLGAMPQLALLGAFVFLATEGISNAAVVALILPVVLGDMSLFGVDPKVVTAAVALPSGLVFNLPIGTPAMAMAFSTGYLTVRDTVKRGMVLTLSAYASFIICIYWFWN